MIFIDQQNIDQIVNMLKTKQSDNLNPDLKARLDNVFRQFLTENYRDNVKILEDFLNYEVSPEYANIVYEQYGISANYYNKLNKLIKKILVYYLERLAQIKGSIKTFEIFAQLFINIFGPLNFYQVIVTKRKVIKDNVVQYVLTYDLKPLLILNPNNILQTFDDKVSLTKKHLMTLNQYADFNVFPAKTNLVYIQFDKSSELVNNFKLFEPMLKAYAMTKLNKTVIQVKKFLDLPSFNLIGSDVYWIILFSEITRIRLLQNDPSQPAFDFNAKFKAGFSMIYPYDALETIEDFLYEYASIRYNRRKELDNLKRRWNAFQYQNVKVSKFENYDDMKTKLESAYPELIQKILSFTTDEEFLDFYFEFYNYSLSVLDNDNYINYFITFIFMNVLTGESFIDNIFKPVYNIFQKYFFPIEMSFLNRVNDNVSIKDKFEALATDFRYSSVTSTKFLDKDRMPPDRILVLFLKRNFNFIENKDYQNIKILSYPKENNQPNDQNQILLNHKFSYKPLIIDFPITFVTSKINENIINLIKNPVFVKIKSTKNEKINLKKDIHIEINSSNSDNFTKKILTKSKVIATHKTNDNVSKNDKKEIEVQRNDYTQVFDNYNIYLIFKNEKYRKLSSYLDNLNYSLSRINDEIYFSLNPVFN